jgi:BASS family bile acid:Na+ symporter
MNMDRLINILVTITLIEMMVTVGLGVTFSELIHVAMNWRVLGMALLANYLLVPAATVALLLLFKAHPMIAAGFLILAVCPGAPYGPPFAAIARGNVTFAVGLMVILAGSSALLAPALLHLLLPLVSGDEPLTVNAGSILVTLLLTQLAPLGVGMAIRHWRPVFAEWLRKPAVLLSKVLNLVAVGFILVLKYELLLGFGARAFVGMMLLLVVSWASGWLLGGPGAAQRRTVMLTTSLRNVGVGLVMATSAFAGTRAITAVLVYGLMEVFGSLLLALWLRMRDPRANGLRRPPGSD